MHRFIDVLPYALSFAIIVTIIKIKLLNKIFNCSKAGD